MSDYYKLTTPGAEPVSLADMKTYMKVTSAADDVLIQSIMDAVVEYGETHTGREFRANTWELLIDAFSARICINRNPVASITSVEHLVSDVFTVVAATTYYKKDLTQRSEILLESDKDWPTNTDVKEHAIKITFVTAPYAKLNIIIEAIKRHVAYLYMNRGDCADVKKTIKASGAGDLYNLIRIPRI